MYNILLSSMVMDSDFAEGGDELCTTYWYVMMIKKS